MTVQFTIFTLDLGGTTLGFAAVADGRHIVEAFTRDTPAADLAQCLDAIAGGFERLRERTGRAPRALALGVPGPTDYANGIVGELANLPAFRGGVPLGALLAERFGVPVVLANDASLFALGEARAGALPWINAQLAASGNGRRCRHLVGVTLGSGLGGGIVHDGRLLEGDHGAAAELWLLPDPADPAASIEAKASTRGLRRRYAAAASAAEACAPDAATIARIATGAAAGHAKAAREAFEHYGRAVGHAIATALALVDGIAVIGGGLAAAAGLLVPAVLAELNRPLRTTDGRLAPRLGRRALDLDAAQGLDEFLHHAPATTRIPGRDARLGCDTAAPTGILRTRLGTTEAVALGAAAHALERLARRHAP